MENNLDLIKYRRIIVWSANQIIAKYRFSEKTKDDVIFFLQGIIDKKTISQLKDIPLNVIVYIFGIKNFDGFEDYDIEEDLKKIPKSSCICKLLPLKLSANYIQSGKKKLNELLQKANENEEQRILRAIERIDEWILNGRIIKNEK